MNKQIDGATLAVLNCYRNKYYTDGINTEQGLVANAINEVLPTLVDVNNGRMIAKRLAELKKKYESEGADDGLE